MRIKVLLVDVNSAMVAAWRETFEDNPEVEIHHGSMLDQKVDAWVSPTNSAGKMDGGLDGVIRNYLGAGIQHRVQSAIKTQYAGAMPVGCATCVETGRDQPRFLISTPTMVSSSENISDTMNVALACAAAFQALHVKDNEDPGLVRTIALPGLGANTGKVPVHICADLMWTGYDLFRFRKFNDFAEMRKALEEILGDLGPTSTKGQAKIAAGEVAGAKGFGVAAKVESGDDEDFDDFDEDGDDEDGEDFDDEEDF
ncbi:MAG: macro domain-containing protein [Myxococcota bacterium]